MSDVSLEPGWTGKRILSAIALAALAFVSLSYLAGYFSGWSAREAPSSVNDNIYVSIGAFAAGLSLWGLFKIIRSARSSGPGSERDKMNFRLIAGAMFVVLLTNLLIFPDITDKSTGVFDKLSAIYLANFSPAAAMIAVIIWGPIMGLVAWYWHKKVLDEHQNNAWKDGAMIAGYAYSVGAPMWWLLWRGGFVIEPNGVIIFLAFNVIWSLAWLWRSYR